jgi:hypothetical protein
MRGRGGRSEPPAAPAPAKDPGVDIAIAEFNALRAEILAHANVQASLVALVVTAIGIVGGLVVKEDGDPRLLLILPYLVAAAGIESSNRARTIALIGIYIRDKLWLYLEEQQMPGSLPSWEALVSDFRRRSKHHRPWRIHLPYLALAGIPSILIYVCGSVGPLVILVGLEKHDDLWQVWAGGAFLTGLYLVLAISVWQLGKPLGEILKGHGKKP